MRSPRLPQTLPPLGPEPQVSVVMPVRDAASTLGRAVDSALRQPEVTEVVLAVGPSSDGTEAAAAALARRDPRVRVVPNPSGVTPAGLNAAIAGARGEVLVRLDGHAELPSGYVATALAALRRPSAANVGGRQVPVGDEGFAGAVARAMISPLGAGGATYRTGVVAGPVDTVYLGVFRAAALREVGGFDPRFVRNQDAELNERLRRAGYEVWFTPDLAVTYRPRASPRALASQYFQYGRWRRLTARIHRGSLRPRQLAPVALVGTLAAAAAVSVGLRRPLPLALVAVPYGAAVCIEGVRVGPLAQSPQVAAALAIMHLSWASGFLLGPPRGSADVGGSSEVARRATSAEAER